MELEIPERRKEHPVIGAVHLHAAALSFLPGALFVLSACLCMIHMRINKLNHIYGKDEAACKGMVLQVHFVHLGSYFACSVFIHSLSTPNSGCWF